MNISEKIKRYLSLAVKDRKYFLLFIGFLLLVFFFMIYGFSHIRSEDATIWTRYSGFGQTHYYREKWFYFYNWVILALVVTCVHGLGSLKLLGHGKRHLAIATILLGILVIVIAYLIASNVFALPR